MGSFSIWHWLIVIAILLLLFGGRGRVSNLMGDLAKGLKSFKSGMAEPAANEEPHVDAAPTALIADTAAPASRLARD